MSDILIKGMEMPKTCCQCDIKIYDPEKRWDENGIEHIGAWICKRTREIIWNTQRGENCPLFSLPERHGRLIDANVLIEELKSCHLPGAPYVDAGISIAIGKVCDASTIIEAEGDEE